MSTNITALSCPPQISPNNRANEGILVAVLIIAILAIGSLFSVVKTVGNRLLRSKTEELQRGGDLGQKSKTSEMPRDLSAASAGANALPTVYPKIKDSETDAELQTIQPQTPTPQIHLPASLQDRARNHAAGLDAIHDWEVSTTDRIRRQKSRKLDRLPSLDEGQKIQDIYAVLAWEDATMRRFRQEKIRRLERLSSVDRQDVVSAEEQVDNAVRALGEAAKRKHEREKGLKSVGEWELSQKQKQSQIGMGERGADVVHDVRTVLWKAGSD